MKTIEFCVLKELKNLNDEKNQTEVTLSSSKKFMIVHQSCAFFFQSIFLKLWFISFFEAVVCSTQMDKAPEIYVFK